LTQYIEYLYISAMENSFDSQSLGRRVNEILILTALSRGPMHGYQAALEIEQRSGGYFRFNHGTLYPILHRLEHEGFIAGGWTDPQAGRARKEYRVTPAGRAYLKVLVGAWHGLAGHLQPFMREEDGDEQVRTGAA
jgi:PadR family transcriptional regulator, regulatory protein PadR